MRCRNAKLGETINDALVSAFDILNNDGLNHAHTSKFVETGGIVDEDLLLCDGIFGKERNQIDKFAKATLDNQWIHVDTERAKAGPFGAPIAHGYMAVTPKPVRDRVSSAVYNLGEPNTVINVLQKGYLLHDRVVRPALVTVAQGKDS